MKILPASNASGASSSSSSTSSQVSGLKLGIVRLGRAAGKVLYLFLHKHSLKSPFFYFYCLINIFGLLVLFNPFQSHSSVTQPSFSLRLTLEIQLKIFFFLLLLPNFIIQKILGENVSKKLRLTLRWIAMSIFLAVKRFRLSPARCIVKKEDSSYHRWRKDQYILVPPPRGRKFNRKWLWIGAANHSAGITRIRQKRRPKKKGEWWDRA